MIQKKHLTLNGKEFDMQRLDLVDILSLPLGVRVCQCKTDAPFNQENWDCVYNS